MDPLLDALKWILGFGATVFFAIVSYWCRSMDAEIKILKQEHNDTKVFLAQIKESISGREKLQDERWKNLDSKIEIVHKDVQALVHHHLKPKKEES